MNLAAQHRGKVKVIITSADEPSQSLCDDIRLQYVLIDTQKRPRRRDWGFDDEDDEDDEDDGGCCVMMIRRTYARLTALLQIMLETSGGEE